MRRLNIFQRSAGDVAELRIKPNTKFVSCVVFAKKYTSAGSHTDSCHSPGANGEIRFQLVLQACKGYDLIFVGVPGPSGGAAIQFEISFNAPLSGALSSPVPITPSVPSAGWTVLV